MADHHTLQYNLGLRAWSLRSRHWLLFLSEAVKAIYITLPAQPYLLLGLLTHNLHFLTFPVSHTFQPPSPPDCRAVHLCVHVSPVYVGDNTGPETWTNPV